MTKEKLQIINFRTFLYSLVSASLFFWAPIASAQGVSVEDLPESIKASTEFMFGRNVTKTIKTPWGPKEIYDPMLDKHAKSAFKSLYDFTNKDDYFQNRPSNLSERSKRDLKRSRSISHRKDVKYLNVARHQSLIELQNAGCAFVATRNCTNLSVVLTPRNNCRFKERSERPFLTEMIGDPMRGMGNLDKQFEMFFENTCNVWKSTDE